MASSLDFGTISVTGSTVRLSGTSSNLDTEALIDALVEAKRLPAVRYENRIDENEARIAALEELETLLGDLKDAVEGLRNPPGVLGIDDNVFETKDIFFSSDTTTSPAELVGVSAANRADPGSFDLVIERLATAHKISSDSVGSATETLADAFNGGSAFSGTFSLGLAGGSTATVTVDGSMDIYDLEAVIDAESATTGVQASVLKVSDTDYRLVLTAEETGKAIELTHLSGDNVPDLVGLTTGGATTIKNELQAAQTSRIQIDGVTIERNGNLIDDAIEGVTLNLFKADPATTVTVDIQRSAAQAKEAIVAFVDAYNAFRDFLDVHRQIDDTGEVAEEAVLFGNSTLRSVAGTLATHVSSQVAGLDANALSSLAAVGITLDADNRLQIDDKTLDDALLGKLEEVRAVFEFTFEADSADLAVFSRTNALADTSFTVDIVDSDGDGVIESATIDGVAADVDGGKITGRAGTPYEGLELIWVGTGDASIQVTATQGIADKLYNALDSMLDDLDGTVTGAIEQLQDENTRYQEEIAAIDERVERYRQLLIEKFAALEAALTVANGLLTQVEATTAAFFGKDQ